MDREERRAMKKGRKKGDEEGRREKEKEDRTGGRGVREVHREERREHPKTTRSPSISTLSSCFSLTPYPSSSPFPLSAS